MNKHRPFNRPFNIWDLKPKEHADFPERTSLEPLVKEPNTRATEAVNEPSGPRSQTTVHVGNDAEVIGNAYMGPLSDEAFVASRRDRAYSNSRDGRFVDPFSRAAEMLDRQIASTNSQDRLIDSSLCGNGIASSRFIDNQSHHGYPGDSRYYDARLGTETKSVSGSRR